MHGQSKKFCIFVLLSVAQLAEHRFVVPKVVSSILTRHLILNKGKTMSKAKEFDKAMNALLLEVDKSIVENIRKIGHDYANEVKANNSQ